MHFFYYKLGSRLDSGMGHEEDATSFLGALITYNQQEGVLVLSQEKVAYVIFSSTPAPATCT